MLRSISQLNLDMLCAFNGIFAKKKHNTGLALGSLPACKEHLYVITVGGISQEAAPWNWKVMGCHQILGILEVSLLSLVLPVVQIIHS
jgi:hypothetical protein